MIILHNIDTNTMLDIKEMFKYYEIGTEFNRLTENFEIAIDSQIPVILKYYNLDSTLRLELGSKYLDIPYHDYSEVTIV